MNPRFSPRSEAGVTLLEVVVVIVLICILAAALLPSPRYGTKFRRMVNCKRNLYQVLTAYHLWAGDHGGKFPMAVSVSNGGSLEMGQTGDVVQTFMVMSNELSSLRFLCCPTDTNRVCATNFSQLANSNISYFVCVGAVNTNNTRMPLLGDSHFEISGVPVGSGLQRFGTNSSVEWGFNGHGIHQGNIGFVDGSVESTDTFPARSRLYLSSLLLSGLSTNLFAIP